MWTFECEKYNGDELAEIFFLQVAKDGWIISKDDKVKIKRLIMKNESAFKAFGGDTERLVYLSTLEASRNKLSSISSTFLSTTEVEAKEKTLTYKHVEKGLIALRENSFN